jgi:hypothetical protein
MIRWFADSLIDWTDTAWEVSGKNELSLKKKVATLMNLEDTTDLTWEGLVVIFGSLTVAQIKDFQPQVKQTTSDSGSNMMRLLRVVDHKETLWPSLQAPMPKQE